MQKIQLDFEQIKSLFAYLSLDEREDIKREITDSLKNKDIDLSAVKFEDLLYVLGVCVARVKILDNKRVIAYGAGNIGKKYLSNIDELFNIIEVWDMYSSLKHLDGISVRKPGKYSDNTAIILLLDDAKAIESSIQGLHNIGFENIYAYKSVVIDDAHKEFAEKMMSMITTKTISVFELFMSNFALFESKKPEILLSIYSKKMGAYDGYKVINAEKVKQKLVDDIFELLLIDKDKVCSLVNCLMDNDLHNLRNITWSIEGFLRELLYESVKTRYRPIRMKGDYPYDGVAVMQTTIVLLKDLFGCDVPSINRYLKDLRRFSGDKLNIILLQSYFLCESEQFAEALALARLALHKAPDGFVANEMFYHVAKSCKEHGIYVDEPICELDLSKYFCWCGMNYAWCGGYDGENDAAAFAPCFRPSCVASPRGNFSDGEEWLEFRKSLRDGSFKYCQKSQCPNIVGGWLPEKDKCENKSIKQFMSGDDEVKFLIDEIHLSYDSHCNLKCPSCRTEICTNTKEVNEKLDDFYAKYLKDYIKAAKHLCLSGCGEAMLSPHSRKILKSLSGKEYDDLKVELRTNATTVNPIAWRELGEGRRCIRHIAASIDAVSKELFEKIRYPAKWEVVYRNLKFMQQLRQNGDIDLLEYHVVVQKDNMDTLTDIVEFAIDMGVDVVTFSRMVNWMGKSEEEYLEVNPFWIESPLHNALLQQIEELKILRAGIEKGNYNRLQGRRVMINIPFVQDPDDSYSSIRYGELKIR